MKASDVAAVVLAAGESKRFGSTNKLLAFVEGTPVICRVVRAAVSSGLRTVVVTGHEAGAVQDALVECLRVRDLDAPHRLEFAHNPRFREGMGTSIACGVSASVGAAGWLVVPGDMPNLTAATLSRVAHTGIQGGAVALVACRHCGTFSPPCYFGRSYLGDLRTLEGIEGAKWILQANSERVAALDVPLKELADLDSTPGEL